MLTVAPADGPLLGHLKVPGDKSISHRALILAAAAEGVSRLGGLGQGVDLVSTRAAMERLGAGIEEGKEGIEISGCGLRFDEPGTVLDCGNSGTTMRLLTGLLAGQPFGSTLDGDRSLRSRPMERVAGPLEGMGASIRTNGGRAPLHIQGRRLAGACHALDIPSAQLKSALLLAGLQAEGLTEVSEPRASRDHTERMLQFMGVALERRGLTVSLGGPAIPQARDISVPGDPSSAAFLILAAVLVPGSTVTIDGVCLNPTRTGFIAVLKRMGADLEVDTSGESCGETVGTITARASELTGTDVGADEIPATIDELPALAVAAAVAKGETRVWGAGELRVKESDRIAAIGSMLTCMGVRVEEHEDGLTVEGDRLRGDCEFDAMGDHRMAMSAAVAGLVADGPVAIVGPEAADVSYPGFFKVLEGLRR